MCTETESSERDQHLTTKIGGNSSLLPDPLTSFLGREHEIVEILALFSQPNARLMTLVGPGGVGKTRLAIEVARAIAARNSSAVSFIPLASVRDSSLVAATIGSAIGLSDRGEQSLPARLSTYLNNAPALLVVDNFEHVIEAAPLIRLLLDTCPTLRILATSRRPLHVSGEVEFWVLPLGIPGPGDSYQLVEQSASYRLFVERAPGQTAGASQTRQDSHTLPIAEICRRLDGLPLAIELAAARTKALTPAELLLRLDQRFSLLTDGPVDAPTRQRNLRDAIAWSYDLLNEDERRLFRTLSVFSGGFTLAAVEAVAGDDSPVSALDLLTRLIDHSLVQRMLGIEGPPRFSMLETIREFALEAMIASGEETDARTRHLKWMVAFIGSPSPERFHELRRPADAPLFDELNNLRLAFTWAVDHHDAPRAAQIAWALLRIWWHFGLTSEALESIQRLVDLCDGLDPVVRAAVLEWLASFTQLHGDDERARIAAADALDKFRELGHTLGIKISLATLAEATFWSDPEGAVELFDQAVEICRVMEDRRVLAWDLHWRSYACIAVGEMQRALVDLEEAVTLFEQFKVDDEVRYDQSLAMYFIAWAWGLCGRIDLATSCVAQGLELSQEIQGGFGIFSANRVLGELARVRGDHFQAFSHLRECLLTANREGLGSSMTFALIQVAMVAQDAGDFARAARLFGYADAYWSRNHFAESALSMASWNFTTVPTRTALGPQLFASEHETGRLLSSFDAFNDATSVTIPERPGNGRSSVLTRRETEVLAHLASGKTNREIAEALFVGRHTVDTHVSHILGKLGVSSRLSAVNVAREQGLL